MTAVAGPNLFPGPWQAPYAHRLLDSHDNGGAPVVARKGPKKSNSSSSIPSSSGSRSSVASLSGSEDSFVSEMNGASGDEKSMIAKRKNRELWSSQNSVADNAGPVAMNGRISVVPPPPKSFSAAVNGFVNGRTGGSMHQISIPPPPAPPPTNDSTVLLVLMPLNNTFERKTMQMPLFPETMRIGRQTNLKTVPAANNGYFDSKVLSRQHAEVWCDKNGKIWIRDVKSSNGTFVNGTRLSPESRESEPHELREHDTLELGIDIVSEDQKVVVHHKVSAKVEHSGPMHNQVSIMDLSFNDLDPSLNGGLLGHPFPSDLASRSRSSSTSTIGALPPNAGFHMNPSLQQRNMHNWASQPTLEQFVKKLTVELKQAKQQSQDLHRTSDYFQALLHSESPKEAKKIIKESPPKRQAHKESRSLKREGSLATLSQPPAPPPSAPLPQKPAGPPYQSPPNKQRGFARTDTMVPPVAGSSTGSSPTSSQILSLVEALNTARREIDTQAVQMKQLEDMLRNERSAREEAERKAQSLSNRYQGSEDLTKGDITATEDELNHPDTMTQIESTLPQHRPDSVAVETTKEKKSDDLSGTDIISTPIETTGLDDSTTQLIERINEMARQMQDMKRELDHYKDRATGAEQERNSLVEMVTELRLAESRKIKMNGIGQHDHEDEDVEQSLVAGTRTPETLPIHSQSRRGSMSSNAAELAKVQQAYELALKDLRSNKLAQSAPYASMVGVVLLGVAVMTYLNGWTKGER